MLGGDNWILAADNKIQAVTRRETHGGNKNQDKKPGNRTEHQILEK